MKSSQLAVPVLALLLSAPLATVAAERSYWLHVRVDEGGDQAKVVINLPFSLIGKALPMMDIGDHLHDNEIHFNNNRMSYEELRDLWQEVRNGPDMNFVTVEEKNESVRVWKEGGFFFVRVRDKRDERVDVRMPLAVVDAFLGTGGEFDLAAAVDALMQNGAGELVTVQDQNESVRVWVDTNPEAGD